MNAYIYIRIMASKDYFDCKTAMLLKNTKSMMKNKTWNNSHAAMTISSIFLKKIILS